MAYQVELQKVCAGKFDTKVLGMLRQAKFGGSTAFEMEVGNHLLKGKVQKLDRPLLFTEKRIKKQEYDGELK